MKRILIRLSFSLLFLFTSIAYAGGGMTHMLLAQEAIAQIQDTQLRNLLQNNLEAYLVGAYYPDSGYIAGNHYGEDSHWDPFIYAFADYIKEKYSDPEVQNPKLVAFLFGCAAHRVSDEILHWNFYQNIARNDFNRDFNWDSTIHGYGDVGIDLLINIDKNQWLTHPTTWWVPVSDLVQVYHRMGKDEYTDKEIIWGNIIIYFSGYAERLISAPSYPFLKWKLPWTSQHYYDCPNGGIAMEEKKVTEYFTSLWSRLHDKQTSSSKKTIKVSSAKSYIENQDDFVTIAFAKNALKNGIVEIVTTHNSDGSVEIQPPVIKSFIYYQQLLVDTYNKVTEQK